MAAIKTISRLATAAFSPADNSIAVGTITGSLDSSFSSSTFVQIHKLDLASDDPELPVIGSCATTEALCRLAWSPVTEQYQSGLLAGSLADGCINVWNPAAIVSEYQSNVQSVSLVNLEKHKQKVLGLDFNPSTPHLLASGSSDGVIYIWDLSDAANPKHYPPLEFREGEGDITCLSWNRKASNVFATTTYDAGCVIWDVKKQRHILRFSDPNGRKRYSAIQWSPEPTKLVVAVDDDSDPVLQEWDLRQPSKPTKIFKGHTKGVGALALCPSDNSILVSCGKDNRTLFWDASGLVIGELPASTWNFDLQWSPRIPGVFSASSHDGQVGIYSIESCHTNYSHAAVVHKAPKWLKRPVGASFGFGGKLVTISTLGTDGVTASEVKIHTAAIEEDMEKCSDEFEAAVKAVDRKAHMKSFCDRKSVNTESEQEREIWAFLKIMLEEDGGRKTLLNELGFHFPDAEAVTDELGEDTVTDISTSQHTDENSFQVIDDAEDFFENLEEPKEPEVAPVENGKVEEDDVIEEEAIDADREIDEKIEQALVVGNFRGAVEHCMSVNRMADALVIAYAGGQALWEKTRNEHLKRNRRSYLQVVSAVATHDLKGLAENRSLSTWKETLALLATYCRGDEWTTLTDILASRLDLSGDTQAATICSICAGNVEKTVEVLSRQLKEGKHAVSTLQDLVEKSIVLTLATEQKRATPALAAIVERYAELLANQGLLESAMVYISLLPGDLPQSLIILQDRIHRNGQAPVIAPKSVEPTPKPATSLQQFQTSQQHQTPQQFQTRITSPQQFQSQSEYVPQQPYSYAVRQPFPGYGAPRSQFVPENQPVVRPLRPATPPMRPPMVPSMSASSTLVPPPAMSVPPPNAGQFVPQMVPRPGNVNPVPFTPMNPAPQPNLQFSTPHPTAQPNPQFSTPPMFTTPAPPQGNMYTTPPPSQAQPLVSHLAEAPTPPTPPPTVQNVDTSNVKDELKPVVEALKRLFIETSDTSKKREREVDDNSRKLGQLFVKLNSGGVSPTVDAKLVQLAQALNARDYSAASTIQTELTSKSWDECGNWLPALRRMTKSRQAMS